jgi:cytoskeleton protein RodZ
MSDEILQQTLFADPLGLRLRHAREGKHWSREAVAQQLKLPIAVIDAIEKEDWARLGAPIYARSYLGSYVRLLGLPQTLVDEAVRPVSIGAAPLVAMGGVPAGKRLFDRGLLNLGYAAITAAILGSVVMLAMHFQSPARDSQVLALDEPATKVATSAEAPTSIASTGTGDQSPVMASMTPSLPSPLPEAAAAVPAPTTAPVAPLAPAGTGEIVLSFRGESWIEILGADGQRIERGLVAAGSERRLRPGEVGLVTLGNADAVEVRQAGRAVDLASFRQANIARFAVSSEGRLTPPGG